VTKASAGRRQRRVERRGRPAGSYASLFKDRQRFSIAAWLALEPIVGPHAAARGAIVWIEEKAPITIQDVEGMLHVAGADYVPATPSEDLNDRARTLARKARLVTSRATKRELSWLCQSSGALAALARFMADGDAVGIATTLELMREVGWGEILDRVGRRLTPALRSNFLPYEGPLTARVRRLLAAMQAQEKLSQH
jgi:hypothetical protein